MSDDQENALVDITTLIEACAASLNYSNPMLCNEETFSLHDSMAALELMDRKMDCCDLSAALIHPNNDPTLLMPPRNIPTGLDDELVPLPWNELTVHDASSIGLEILSRLESLLSGASVAESTYTCLYAHNAVLIDMKERLWTQQFDSMNILLEESQDSNIPQFLVYATTLALVEISDVIRSIVMHADIYEEEDFSINTFGIQFFPDADRPRIIKTIEEARKRLSKLRDEEYSSDVIIMDHILEFQLLFLQICSSLAKLSTTPALDVTKEAQLMSREGVKVLNKIMSLLDEQPNPTRSNDILNRCFDPFVYRPLVGSAPVRKVSMHSPRESLPILSKLLSEVDWAVCKLLLEGSTLLQIRQMLNRASLSSVNILSRSLIVLNLYFDDKLLGRHPLASLIGSDVAQLMHLPKALLDSIHGQAFLGRLCKPIYDALKLLVFNRNRQRVYMESIMFYDWSVLQQEASVVDMHHRQEHGVELPSYFTYYAIYFMSWLMDYYVALGIELRLYCGHHDLAVAFWYRDFLLSSLLSTMASIRAAKKESEETNDSLEDIEVMIVGFKRILCRGIVRVSCLSLQE